MNRTLFSLLIAAATAASPAFAASVTQADVGRFVRDRDGAPMGSLQAIQGDQAVVWYGFVHTPGNRLATVPLSTIVATDGRLGSARRRVRGSRCGPLMASSIRRPSCEAQPHGPGVRRRQSLAGGLCPRQTHALWD